MKGKSEPQQAWRADRVRGVRHGEGAALEPPFMGRDDELRLAKDTLIATGREESQIAQALNADRVIYLDQQSIREAIGLKSMCMACLDGDYPTDISAGIAFREKRKGDRKK